MEERAVQSFEDLAVWRAAVSMMSHVAKGCERLHLQEKLQFCNRARGSSAEVRSLLYVVADNYPSFAAQSASLRKDVVRAGKLITGLIQSTQQRKQAQKNS